MWSLTPINFKKWVEENRDLLKPPVGNKRIYTDTGFVVQVVGGPNSRKDFHDDPGEEFFYQVEGDMLLKTMQDGQPVDVPIREGEMVVTGIQNAEGSTLMTLADMSVITAEVKVDETDIVNVAMN